MGKTGYLLDRILKLNYKNLFETINSIHKEAKKSKISILKDMISCGTKYQAGYTDYKLFEMYNLNDKQRATIITRGINNDIVEKYNDPKYINYFKDKREFNKKFHKYLLRDWMTLTEDNYEEFKTFVTEHPVIFVKPTSEKCGVGAEKIEVKKDKIKDIYDNLLTTERLMVEEYATQCKELASLHPSSINTIRVITLNGSIVACYLRIGNNNNVVDNFNKEGLVAPINIETGIIDYLAVDKKGNTYERHPITDESIIWFRIPKWPRIKRFVLQAAKEIPEVGYVGWDVSLGIKDPFIVEGNHFPGHDIYQLPPHRTNNIGLLPVFEKAMNEKGEQENEDSNSN